MIDEIMDNFVDPMVLHEVRIRTPEKTGFMLSQWEIIKQSDGSRVLYNGAPYSGHVLNNASSAEALRNYINA